MNRKMLAAIAVGGGTAGLLDIISAISPRGRDPGAVLQYIASGLLGKTAFTGGQMTVAAGLVVHFGLTTIMAALFTTAALRFPILRRWPWIAGFCYGALVFFAMFYVIVPLSAAQGWKTPQGFLAIVNAAMGHGVFVGVPIAVAARHFLGEEAMTGWARTGSPLRSTATPAVPG